MKKIQKRSRVINVTERDIKLGEKDEPSSCPVARAIARSFHKKIGTYSVWEDTIESGRTFKHVSAPRVVQTFVSKFDRSLPVNPFTFTLEY